MTTIEHEYESRSMISEEKYFEIASSFYREDSYLKTITQRNQYFDSEDFFLTNNNIVLRIRITNKGAVLTLKISEAYGHSKEISQKISYFQHKALIEKSHFPKGQIKLLLMAKGIPLLSLKYICEMKTKRIQVNMKNYNYCIDKNEYQGIADYNIEVEARSMDEANKIMKDLSIKYNFEISKEYIVKSKRAILYEKR